MPRWFYVASGFFVLHAMAAFGIIDRLLYGEWLGKPGDKVTQSLNLLLIITSLALFSRGVRQIGGIRTGAILAIGVAVFFLFSAAWSIAPQTTVREAILYLLIVLGAIGIAASLDGDEFMDLLALMCFASAVASLALLAVSPANAHGGEGDFRGIFSQKNVLGGAMTMGALASLHGLRSGRRRRLRSIFFLVVDTIVALLSQSATSCLTIFAFCAMDVIIVLIRKGGAIRILTMGLIVLVLPVVISVAVSPDVVLEMMGKDPTLTGRTEIWNYVIPYIYERPWLGWGYVAFWSTDNPAAMDIAKSLHWFAPQAHNGLLELLLHVGLVGTALFIFLWARALWLSLRCMRTAEKALAVSCLFSCLGVVLVGISETVLIVPFEASTSVFFIVGLLCEKAVRAVSPQQSPVTRYNASPAIRLGRERRVPTIRLT